MSVFLSLDRALGPLNRLQEPLSQFHRFLHVALIGGHLLGTRDQARLPRHSCLQLKLIRAEELHRAKLCHLPDRTDRLSLISDRQVFLQFNRTDRRLISRVKPSALGHNRLMAIVSRWFCFVAEFEIPVSKSADQLCLYLLL